GEGVSRVEDPSHTFLAEIHFLRDLAARVAQSYPLSGPLTVDLVRNTGEEDPIYRLTLAVGEGKNPFGSVAITEPMLAHCRSDLDIQRELTSRIMSAIELGLRVAPRSEEAPGPAFRVRDPRFPLAVPVRITVQGVPETPAPRRLEGLTANVSEGGVALDLPDRLEPWTPLSLRVEAEGGPVVLEVLVVWAAEPAAARSPVRHGCIIVTMDPDQRETWRRLLRTFGYQRPYTRRHPRYPLAAPVRCSVEAIPAALEGEAENVGAGGLLVRLPLALTVGALVQAALRLGGAVLERPARVIWVLGATGDDGRRIYRHGLEFTGEPLPRDVVLQFYRVGQMEGGGRRGVV
ncbi:MAG: PilZ domain-containing protein, partial [candidate division NC10 bacterium]|nr:PilZ domain-containing protein [candidate division NC10 bacterium]